MKKFSSKRALLLSVISMVICVSMLIGSTFAWFTDSATANVNTIQAGNLAISFEMRNSENEGWADAKNATLNFLRKDENGNLVADANILWEPGCTFELPELKVENVGNLALKYQLVISGATNGNDDGKDGLKLLEVLKFTASVNGVEGDEVNVKDGTAIATGELNKNGDKAVVKIKASMDQTAGNDYKGLKISGISVKVVATQTTYEYDSFNNQYDKDAPLDFVPVSTAAELKTVFANATAGEDVNVSLTDDIDLGADNTLMIVDENSDIGDINIQANGHTIKNAVAGARVLQMAKSDAERTITITGAKIVSEGAVTSSENRGVQIFSVDNATVNLVNCDIEMNANDYSYPVKIGGTSKNTTVNITGCTLTGANCIESFGTNCTVNITDCVLNSNYAPNATYCGNGIQDKNGTNNTYNIKNTTFNGTNAQPWQTSSTTVINDLGGNVYNTTRTTH